jgi:phosphinothricin acetyltransferase
MISDAVLADLPAIVAIYNAAIPGRLATADTNFVSVDARRAWFDGHSTDRRPLLILEREGLVAGWLSFQSFYGRPAYDGTAELSVYVAPQYQRSGVGRELLADAIRRAPSLGLRILLGFIFSHNAPSLALFEGFGFQRWAHLPGIAELDGHERDLIIVGLRVD